MRLCATCGHAEYWHDDRAIVACLPRITVFGKSIRCSCMGWQA